MIVYAPVQSPALTEIKKVALLATLAWKLTVDCPFFLMASVAQTVTCLSRNNADAVLDKEKIISVSTDQLNLPRIFQHQTPSVASAKPDPSRLCPAVYCTCARIIPAVK